jgi:transposase
MATGSEPDDKTEALRRHRTLNPTPERVTDERFLSDGFFDPRDLAQVKYEMVRRVHEEGATVSEAARAFGFSRPTFYQAQEALDAQGLAGLVPKRPGPRTAHKLSEEVMAFVGRLRAGPSKLSSQDLADEIEKRFGRTVHPRSIERALKRQEKKRQALG